VRARVRVCVWGGRAGGRAGGGEGAADTFAHKVDKSGIAH
jgi:hypothetical protein